MAIIDSTMTEKIVVKTAPVTIELVLWSDFRYPIFTKSFSCSVDGGSSWGT